MHQNEQNVGEIVSYQQIIVCYHGNNVSLSIKLSHTCQRLEQKSNNIH